MKISQVPTEHIDDIWWIAEPLLQRALDSGGNHETTDDIYIRLIEQKSTLWIIFEGQIILGVLSFSVMKFPNRKILNIDYLSGTRGKEWPPVVYGVMLEYAKAIGCDSIRTIARKEWNRVPKKYGFKHTHNIFEMELK